MKNLKLFLIAIFLIHGLSIAQSETIYEDAEDGLTSRWAVYDDDPAGATINNVDDVDRGSKVIVVNGSGKDNGYMLGSWIGGSWNNTTQFFVEWSHKYSEGFIIYIDVETTDGHRYINYTESSNDALGTGEYVHHGLGNSSMDGAWQTFTRDLQADLHDAQPTVAITLVNGFLVRGSGRVDDIKLMDSALPVELTTFTASTKESEVSLVWETATEVNNYGFEIERQTQVSSIKNQDKNQTWEKISFVEGHGNSNSPKYYEFTDETSVGGKYFYRLKQIDIDGSFEYSKTVEVDLGLPTEFELSQNYPNPFNPTTTIKYKIPNITSNVAADFSQRTTLKVYDVLGTEVATLVNKNQEVGSYEVNFDASNLTSGIYFYALTSGSFVQTKKMILLR